MTNERAIELLHRISDSQFDGIHGDERREALEMAVRALESNLVKESGGLVKDLVKDCISRQQAIDAFEPEHDTDWYTPQIIEVLEALPPVQPTHTNAESTQCNTLDCVSRRAAIDGTKKEILERDGRFYKGLLVANHVILHLPSAQPERKRGRWLPDNNCYYETRYICSECKLPFHVETIMMKPAWRFCPNCGARMEGGDSE